MVLSLRQQAEFSGMLEVNEGAVACCKEQQMDDSCSNCSTSSSGKVSIDGLLQLWPPQLEAALWQSPSAHRLLEALDSVCLFNSVVVAAGLLLVFWAPMNWVQLSQAAMFGVLAVIQICVMRLLPAWYQQHRFKITLVNRVLRLFVVAFASLSMSGDDIRRMDNFLAPMQGMPDPRWVHFLRYLIGTPLFYLNHANFILPVVYVLPAQLLTVLGVTATSRYAVCLMLERPGYLMLSQQLCQGLKVTMHYLSMLLGRPPKEAAAAAASECAGVDGLLLVALFFNSLLLVVVPCLVVYFVELDLKRGFIRQKNLIMQHAGPIVESRLGKAVVVYGAVVGSWMACEVLVLVLSPFECSKCGQITPSRWL